jgi:hypothetical protein
VFEKKEMARHPGITLCAGMLAVVIALALVSKLKGDEQVLEDIDRYTGEPAKTQKSVVDRKCFPVFEYRKYMVPFGAAFCFPMA